MTMMIMTFSLWNCFLLVIPPIDTWIINYCAVGGGGDGDGDDGGGALKE